MPDIEGTVKGKDLTQVYLFPNRNPNTVASVTGDDGAGDTSSIEGTEE
jgi:hypothetical protein